MSSGCLVCQAKGDTACVNTIDPDSPLPGRSEHFGRSERSSVPGEERRQ